MSVLKDIARYFGFTDDTRVTISAPGVDVVITGRPDKVSYLLEVVKTEMERSSKKRKSGKSDVVRPTELDEMDSPYVLPEGRVVAAPEAGGAPAAAVPPPSDPKQKARARPTPPGGPVKREVVRSMGPPILAPRIEEPATLLPEIEEATPEGEATAVQPNPSGPARLPSMVSRNGPISSPRSPSIVPRAVPQAEIATMEVSPSRGTKIPARPARSEEDLSLSEFAEVSESDIQKI